MHVIGIQNYGSSGTTLLHSLFDQHPQILQLPGLYGIGYYSHWRSYIRHLRRNDIEATDQELDDLVLDFFSVLWDPNRIERGWGLRELGPDRNQTPCPSKSRFLEAYYLHRRRLHEMSSVAKTPEDFRACRRARILAIYLAYEEALGRDLSRKTFLVYPAHSCTRQDILDLMEDFPDCHFIHMVRNPVNLFNSVIKYYEKYRTTTNPIANFFVSAVTQIFLDRSLELERDNDPLHSIYFYDESVKQRSRAVRLEDLHRSPRVILQKICDWIGLEWNECLMTSTFGGLQWWNRPGIKRVSGFDSSIVSRDIQTATTAFDEERLMFVGQPVFEKYYPEEMSRVRRPAFFSALSCLAFFKLEITRFDQLRALFIFAEHLKRIAPSKANQYERHATEVFESRRLAVDPAAHVVIPVAQGEQKKTPSGEEKSGKARKLIWHFADDSGTKRTIEVSGDFAVPDSSRHVFHVLSANAGWRLRRIVRALELAEARLSRPAPPPPLFVSKLANRYCFALDYVRNRYFLMAAARFLRIRRDSLVPLLYDLPVD